MQRRRSIEREGREGENRRRKASLHHFYWSKHSTLPMLCSLRHDSFSLIFCLFPFVIHKELKQLFIHVPRNQSFFFRFDLYFNIMLFSFLLQIFHFIKYNTTYSCSPHLIRTYLIWILNLLTKDNKTCIWMKRWSRIFCHRQHQHIALWNQRMCERKTSRFLKIFQWMILFYSEIQINARFPINFVDN